MRMIPYSSRDSSRDSSRESLVLLLLVVFNAPIQAFNVPPPCFLRSSVKIVEVSDTERGIQVSPNNTDDGNHIEPNEVILSVPIECIVTPWRAYKDITKEMGNSEMMDVIQNGIDKRTLLAFWLCHQHAAKVRRQETTNSDNLLIDNYLDMLPTNLQHIPVFWSDEELTEVEGSILCSDTRTKRTQWTDLYQRIASLDPSFPKQTSMSTFFWAKALVESRVFCLRQDYLNDNKIEEREIGLVPYADMLNHRSRSDPYTCDWKIEQNENGDESETPAFVIRAGPRGLKPGMEVYHSYGLHSNAHYLSYYGFAIGNNTRHDGACPDQAHIDLLGRRIPIRIGDKEHAITLLAELRESVLQNHYPYENREQHSDKYRAPISIQNERDAMKPLLQCVETAVSRYKTTIQEDLEMLRQDCNCQISFPNKRNAILVRVGEKNVLYHWQAMCQASLLCLKERMAWSDYCGLLNATLDRVESIVSFGWVP